MHIGQPVKIAACLIVRNEAFDIAEWLAYHAALGIDAFLIYDNGSIDGTDTVLQAAAGLLDIRITPWRSPSSTAQMEAYKHAIRTNRHEFDWIAVIDSDEFIVVHGCNSLHHLCKQDAAAIGINWAMFGTNGHEQRPTQLVIEAFTCRAEDGFSPNHHVKSLVRPAAVYDCVNPHAFAVHGPTIHCNGQPLDWQSDGAGSVRYGLTETLPDYTAAQVNHYFTRSRAHWSAKIARGYRNLLSMAKLGFFDVYDRNEIVDKSALWCVDEVHKIRGDILRRAHQLHPALAALSIWQMEV